jgi:DtxR family Mn-dependent transcriptional regulator
MTHMPHPLSVAAEDCLKGIYLLSEATGQASVGALAERLGVTPASVSAMIRRLAERHEDEDEDDAQAEGESDEEVIDGPYVILTPYRGVALTEQGRLVAVDLLRRHRLLELFLTRELDVPVDRAHIEAECLEHDLSEDLEERIFAKLGYPTRGVHGQPIPRHDGTIPIFPDMPLSELAPGTPAIIAAVPPHEPDLLQYLQKIGATLGARIISEGSVPYSDSLLVRIEDTQHPLGMAIARRILVQIAETETT